MAEGLDFLDLEFNASSGNKKSDGFIRNLQCCSTAGFIIHRRQHGSFR